MLGSTVFDPNAPGTTPSPLRAATCREAHWRTPWQSDTARARRAPTGRELRGQHTSRSGTDQRVCPQRQRRPHSPVPGQGTGPAVGTLDCSTGGSCLRIPCDRSAPLRCCISREPLTTAVPGVLGPAGRSVGAASAAAGGAGGALAGSGNGVRDGQARLAELGTVRPQATAVRHAAAASPATRACAMRTSLSAAARSFCAVTMVSMWARRSFNAASAAARTAAGSTGVTVVTVVTDMMRAFRS